MFFGVGFVGGGGGGSVLQVGKCHAGHLQSEVVMRYIHTYPQAAVTLEVSVQV